MTEETDAQRFKRDVYNMSMQVLTTMVGKERAREAAGRVQAAIAASVASAKDPADFYACTRASIAQATAVAALTGIMPGTGQAALAYVIPRRPRKNEQPQLQYQLSHRGVAALVKRGGTVLYAVPVSHDDMIRVEYGEVVDHDADIDNPPLTWEELRGCIAVIKDAASGAVLFRGWVALKIIDQHRQQSDTFKWAERTGSWAYKISPWHTSPVPMAQKTTMHYAIARGWAVVDDTESSRALSIDAAADVIETTAEETAPARQVASRMPTARPDEVPEALRLPDGGDIDEAAEFNRQAERAAQREPVEVDEAEGANGTEAAIDPRISRIEDMDRSLPTRLAVEIRQRSGVGVTTKPTDGRLSSETIGRWHDALVEAEERAAMQADQ